MQKIDGFKTTMFSTRNIDILLSMFSSQSVFFAKTIVVFIKIVFIKAISIICVILSTMLYISPEQSEEVWNLLAL